MRFGLCATLLTIGLAVSAPLQAQTADPVLTPGRILRITWMAQGLEQQMATVDRFYRDTIFAKAQFTDGSRTVTESLRILLREVDRVEYSTTTPVARSGGATGLLLGAVLGGVLGGATVGTGGGTSLDAQAAAAGVLGGALVGGLLGGVMGAMASREPRPDAYQWSIYCTKTDDDAGCQRPRS